MVLQNPWANLISADSQLYQFFDVEVLSHSIHISPKYRYLFCETPKVACSTVKSTLQRAELSWPELEYSDDEFIHNRQYSPFIGPLQTGDFARTMNDPNIFKFAFVRNPFTRVLSGFLDKIRRNQPQKAQILRMSGRSGHDLSVEISFSEFIDAICAMPDSMLDVHWALQSQVIFLDSINYDFIGRFEQLEHDARLVFDHLSIDFESYWKRHDPHHTGADNRLLEYFDCELIEKVLLRYDNDFRLFGYDRSLPI